MRFNYKNFPCPGTLISRKNARNTQNLWDTSVGGSGYIPYSSVLLPPQPCSSLLFPPQPCSSLPFPALPCYSPLFPATPRSSLLLPATPCFYHSIPTPFTSIRSGERSFFSIITAQRRTFLDKNFLRSIVSPVKKATGLESKRSFRSS